MWTDPVNIYIAHRHMNVEIGMRPRNSLSGEYINGIFVAVYYCISKDCFLPQKIQDGVYSQNLHVDFKIVAIWLKIAHKNVPIDKFVCKVKLFYFEPFFHRVFPLPFL